jgi:uncharacterized protein (TIGR01777 family)
MKHSGKVLITGGSGIIGKRLTALLETEGYEVAWMSRKVRHTGRKVFVWNIENGNIDSDALEWADYIIHLAGEGIADMRWTRERKQQILDSRVRPAELLLRAMQGLGGFSGRIICASAIGYYGAVNSDKELSEVDAAGDDFMADVCVKWERSSEALIDQSKGGGSILRVGIVLSAEGGALAKMAAPVRFYAGAKLASGKQKISWIHIDDVCRMFIFCMKNSKCKGIYNAAGPQFAVHDAFMNSVARVLRRPIFLPHVPEFALKAILGEMAVMVTRGPGVSSARIRSEGFQFEYPDLESALMKELRD